MLINSIYIKYMIGEQSIVFCKNFLMIEVIKADQ